MSDTGNVPILLPRPRSIERRSGWLRLNAATAIQVAPVTEPGAATVRTARGLQDALANQFGLTLPIVPTANPAARNALSLVLLGRDEDVFPAEAFGWDPAAVPDDGSPLAAQGYAVRIGEDGAVVAARGEAGLFYGAQKLIQLAKTAGRRWPALAIADRPALPVRGLMLDVSRGKVPRLDTLTSLARTLAHYGYNQLQLYTEHTFHFPRHPQIGAGADPLTSDDVLVLDAVCRAHHVELVPNLQSLGHQTRLLSLPQYADLAETDWRWSLATANEAGFTLLDDLYGDMLPAFSSCWFNADADEPWDLGLGQSKHLTAAEGVGRVYIRHIKRLHALAAKHGRRMMMWADVFWHHPELVGEVPEDVLLLDWWYEVKDRFETVEVIAKAGRRFYVCPGTGSWISLYPRTETAFANIAGFVRDGVAAGAEGMLLTDWGDGGHYQPLSQSWYPYLWGAECGWTGATTAREDFDAAFGRLFVEDGSGRVVAALRRLGAAMQAAPEYRRTWNTPMALWEEPLAGTLYQVASPETVAETSEAAEALLHLLGLVRDPEMRADLGFSANLITFACAKVERTRAIRVALQGFANQDGASEDGIARLDELITALRSDRNALPALVSEFEARWVATARRSEIGMTLGVYARLGERYDAALAWLGKQRAAYAAGRALDAALTTYDTGDYAVLYQARMKEIARLAEIVGIENLPPDVRSWVESHAGTPEPAPEGADA